VYIFTNKEYYELFEAIERGDKVIQIFCMYRAHFRKAKENEKIRKRVNEKRKTNKNYGRPKQKNK
jgi:hypothetical protein